MKEKINWNNLSVGLKIPLILAWIVGITFGIAFLIEMIKGLM